MMTEDIAEHSAARNIRTLHIQIAFDMLMFWRVRSKMRIFVIVKIILGRISIRYMTKKASPTWNTKEMRRQDVYKITTKLKQLK